jgi:spore coat polysaccharide biosynthesis protein SpsF (cytidylyltransferase family)
MIAPLAIIQARLGSTRLPGKLLLPVGGTTLIHHVHRLTVEAFGATHTVVAYPETPENVPLRVELDRIGARCFPWNGPENDVLGRFWHCAHRYRWHPDSVIVRVTPDDPFKDPSHMRRVANGERLPVETGAEAFTLAMLDVANMHCHEREHLTHALFRTPPPPPPDSRVWSIDTKSDYLAVVTAMGEAPVSPFDDGPWSPC